MKRSKYIIIFSLSVMNFYLFAQAPTIQWQKCYGGWQNEGAQSIEQTTDGGYIVVGSATSNTGDVSGLHGSDDYWIIKLDASGALQWQKCFGGTSADFAYSVQQTTDGGYIVAGSSTSANDGDVTGNHGWHDYWVVKMNAVGVLQWEKSLGGTGYDIGTCIQQTNDSGFIVTGYVGSTDGDVTSSHGGNDYWVVRLNSSGNILWKKCYGGTGDDQSNFVQQTVDGGYIIAGLSNSNDGDVSGGHGDYDDWIVKVDSAGAIQWQKSFGGTGEEQALCIKQTPDKGYIVSGISNSADGDVTGIHGTQQYIYDYWIIKLDSIGALQWQKAYGGTGNEWAPSIWQTTDGGYAIAGFTTSNDGDVSGYHTGSIAGDYWVIKLDSNGNWQWGKCIGGTSDESGNCIQQTNDAGFIIAGGTDSNDGDVSGNHGGSDFWIVKLNPEVGIEQFRDNIFDLTVLPNPATDKVQIIFTEKQKAEISLYDVYGKELKNLKSVSSNEKTEIDVSDLPEGVYFLKVKTNEGVLSKKIIVQH